jgi:multidrug efflux system outer membrane protein
MAGAAVLALTATYLAGCQSVPKPQAVPAPLAPAAWNGAWNGAGSMASADTPRADRALWWRDWNDPVLDGLMEAALRQNLDVKVAMARVDEARALGRVNDAYYKPSVSLGANLTGESGLKAQGGYNDADTRLSGGVTANWSPDIYGLQKLESELGRAGLGAADAQYRGAVSALLAEVAKAYVDLRQQQAVSALLDKNIALETETLRVIRIQTQAGAGVQLDVLRAEAQVETTRSQLPSVRAAMQIDCNRIAVLLGETPGARNGALKPVVAIPVFVKGVALDAPAAVIADRPDVQNAEYQLQQQADLKSIRSADLFPQISLSGFFGVGSSSLFGSSTPLTLGADLARPLIDYGRIKNQIKAQDARAQEALFAYQQSVLLAVEDVERSLVVYGQEQQRLDTLHKAAGIQGEATRQAQLKYQAGGTTTLDVLIAEQDLLNTQLGEAQSQARLASAGVDLYTSLGLSVARMSPAVPNALASNR